MNHPIYFVADIALRSSLMLVLLFAILWIMRRRSAADRHLVLLSGLIMVAILPLGILAFPKLSWNILPIQSSSAPTVSSDSIASHSIPGELPQPQIELNLPSGSDGVVAILVAGMFVQLVSAIYGLATLRTLWRGASAVTIP